MSYNVPFLGRSSVKLELFDMPLVLPTLLDVCSLPWVRRDGTGRRLSCEFVSDMVVISLSALKVGIWLKREV
jgi:hypothetical protein